MTSRVDTSRCWPLKGILLFLVWAGLPGASAEDPFTLALRPDDLDLPQCTAWGAGDPVAADAAVILHVLGLQSSKPPRARPWVGPGGRTEKGDFSYQFRVAFKSPIAVGSLLTDTTDVRYLKAEASYPGDPTKPEQWDTAPSWPSQSGLGSFVLAPGTKTRAVLLTKSMSWDRRPPTVDILILFRARLLNVCPAAFANASEEYTPPPAAGGPRTPPMTIDRIVTGRGMPWQNTGTDRDGHIRRPPIDQTNPVYVTLSWRQAQRLVGMLPAGECGGFLLSRFDGPANVPPNAGTRREWRRVPHRTAAAGILAFDPCETRGLLVTITRGGQPSTVASLSGMHAYVDLGDQPVPPCPRREASPPPVTLRYSLPHDGLAALVIDDEQGTRVRNLFALQERRAGPQEDGWDGKDMDGRYVAPGQYRWKAITCRPLELHYQFTFYPNISDNTPWQIGPTGPGGWIADHAPPTAVCTWGDRVWMGSPCSESGVSLVETDLSGKKIAGWSAFGPFVGAQYLATDGETVFVSTPQENLDTVWGYDPIQRNVRTVLEQKPTETRKTGLTGLAARQGQVYLAIRAKSAWLTSAFGDVSVDPEACWPRYRPARKPIRPYEIVPDPRDDTLRLFRLKGTPPGNGSIGLTWLETEDEAGPRHHILLAFHKPQSIGCAVFPVPRLGKEMKFHLSLLKPDAQYPPNQDDKSQWRVLEDSGRGGQWDVVPFPENTMTRAVRITWEKVGEDPLSGVEEDFGDGEGRKDGTDLGTPDGSEDKKAGPKWRGLLEGMRFLRHRYANAARTATIRVSSGSVNPDGEWDARRKTPITAAEPGIYVMEWDTLQKIRGLAVQEIDGRLTLIEAHTGPADQPIDIAGTKDWAEVAQYLQARRDHHSGFESCNVNARYLDEMVDFGREIETRAIRLRIVDQWHDHGPRSDFGVRPDRGGKNLDPTRCRIYGVAALSHLGGETPVDPRQTERIAVYHEKEKRYVHEVAIRKPGCLAFSPQGDLLALSEGKVVKVDPASATDPAAHKTVIDDLKSPQCLTVGQDGRIHVFDADTERQNIRIYDSQGKLVRTLGREGGRNAGVWQVDTFQNVTAMSVDKDNSLWVVECSYWPKRISKWSPEGQFIREHLGPTQYGGAGVLDPYDKTRAYYGPLEFALDWDKGTSRLQALTWTGPTPAGEVPLIFRGRRYLVTRGDFNNQSAAFVYIQNEDGRSRLAGGMGRADQLPQLQHPKFLSTLRNISLPDHRFLWSDLNGNGEIDVDELQIQPRASHALGLFNSHLSINAGPLQFRVKEVLPTGVPVWEEVLYPKVTVLEGFQSVYQPLVSGRIFVSGVWNGVVTPEGNVLWKYPTCGRGVQALHHAPPYYPGQIAGEFATISHPDSMAAPKDGELGDFEVHSSNPGAWSIWTHDGFLAGHLFRDQRHPGTSGWTMPEHARGLRLDNHTPGQEHFNGYFCRTSDGKFYVVAGHNHASIVEVKGLETFRRFNGPITITPEEMQRIRQWEIGNAHAEVYARAPVYDLFRFKTAPKIDGDSVDWGGIPVAQIESGVLDEEPPAAFRMAYDSNRLYLLYEVRQSPMKNAGGDWRTLFRSGASVDLQMSVKPDIPQDREAPAEGDLRLLVTFIDSKPIAVLYCPVVPGTPPGSAFEVVSPVGKVVIDEVRRLDDIEVAVTGSRGYSLEASIPIAPLGFKPELGQRYRFDWGILTTDDYGNACTARIYWSNKATGILADAPSEARLMPNLWGFLRVHEYPRAGPVDLHSLSTLDDRGKETTDAIDVEKEFEEKGED